jgi:hypothetical protein
LREVRGQNLLSSITGGGSNRGIPSKNLKKFHLCSFSVPAYPFRPLFWRFLKEKPNFRLVTGGPDRTCAYTLLPLSNSPDPLPREPLPALTKQDQAWHIDYCNIYENYVAMVSFITLKRTRDQQTTHSNPSGGTR